MARIPNTGDIWITESGQAKLDSVDWSALDLSFGPEAGLTKDKNSRTFWDWIVLNALSGTGPDDPQLIEGVLHEPDHMKEEYKGHTADLKRAIGRLEKAGYVELAY